MIMISLTGLKYFPKLDKFLPLPVSMRVYTFYYAQRQHAHWSLKKMFVSHHSLQEGQSVDLTGKEQVPHIKKVT